MPLIALTSLILASLAGESLSSETGQPASYPCDEVDKCRVERSDNISYDLLQVNREVSKKAVSQNKASVVTEGAQVTGLNRGWPFDIGMQPTPPDYNPTFGITASTPEDCGYLVGLQEIGFSITNVTYNNLGCMGPELFDPPELRFHNVGTVGGTSVDLKITNLTEYLPFTTDVNGIMENGNVGQIDVACGETAVFKFEYVETGTDTPVTVDYGYLTFADLDNSAHLQDKEMLSVYPVDNIWVADDYEYDLNTSLPSVVTAMSTEFGRGCDNPTQVGSAFSEVTCPDGVVVDQLKRALEVGFQSVSSINVTFGIGPCDLNGGIRTHGRNFVFAGKSTPPAPDCTTTTTTTTTTTVPHPSAVDDPHCTNLRGENFMVNQPAEYVLLRIPQDTEVPALLDLRGTMEAAPAAKCGVYITMVTVSGDWLGEKVAHVRALRRNRPGSNSAGNATEWPFALKVSTRSSTRESSWEPMSDFSDYNASFKALTAFVSVGAVWAENMGLLLEAQTFEFRIDTNLPSDAGPPTTIVVSQASHQALNINVLQIGKLGFSDIGGILGTEKHDPAIEKLSNECKQARAEKRAERSPHSQLLTQESMSGAFLRASWL